jgi:hypothetical protein
MRPSHALVFAREVFGACRFAVCWPRLLQSNRALCGPQRQYVISVLRSRTNVPYRKACLAPRDQQRSTSGRRSMGHASTECCHWSCGQQRASPACCAIKAAAPTPLAASSRSTTASRRVSPPAVVAAERPQSLYRVDQHALDVAGSGWTTPSHSKCGVKPHQLHPCMAGCELPISFGVFLVSFGLPSSDFVGQRLRLCPERTLKLD